jgi:hypothetical protein
MSNIKQTIIAAAVAVTFTTTAQADSLSDSLPLGKSLAAGQELPLPLGISANVFFMEQDMTAPFIGLDASKIPSNVVEGLVGSAVGSQMPAGTPPAQIQAAVANAVADVTSMLPNLQATADKIESRATSTTAKIDAWVLPFLNVYGVVGYVDGETTASGLSVNDPMLDALLPSSFALPYSGPVYGGGVTLAAGYNQFFASVDANYTEADLDIGDSSIEAFVISPRVGITGELGGLNGSLYVGAMYQDVDENQNGTVPFPIPGVGPVPVGFDVISQAEDEWNYLVGANLKAGESWHYGIEVGFSERTHVMATLNYRF